MILFLWILIQIVGESLPISSSGHVELMQKYFQVSFQNLEQINFLLHGPAILILLIYFFSTWWRMVFLQGFDPRSKSGMTKEKSGMTKNEDMDPRLREDEEKDVFFHDSACVETVKNICQSGYLSNFWCILKNKLVIKFPHSRAGGNPCFQSIFKTLFYPARFIVIADFITFIFWKLAFFKLNCIQNYFLPFGFFITFLCLFFSKYFQSKKINLWSMRDATVLGMVQGICLFPGISRFVGTYTVGLWLGYDRMTSVALSFLIQFPLLCAAFCKEIMMPDNVEIWNNLMQPWIIFAIMIATVISYVMFCWVIRLIEKNKLWYFSFYMILPISMSLFLMVKDIML